MKQVAMDAHLIKNDALFSSNGIKKLKDDAVRHQVAMLIKQNAEEKSFDAILATINSIIPIGYKAGGENDAATMAHGFTLAHRSSSEQTRVRLRVWYALYLSPCS